MNLVQRPAWMPAVPGLAGKTVVVAGGSGGVGEGVVRVLLSGGWTISPAGPAPTASRPAGCTARRSTRSRATSTPRRRPWPDGTGRSAGSW